MSNFIYYFYSVLSSVEHSSNESLETQIAKGIKSLGIGDPDTWIGSTTENGSKSNVNKDLIENETSITRSNVNEDGNNSDGNRNNNNNNTSRNPDSDEVRLVQKVLGSEIVLSSEECIELLSKTGWDVHKAIKCARLKRKLVSHNVDLNDFDWIDKLKQFNWNCHQAFNYLIATLGSSTEV